MMKKMMVLFEASGHWGYISEKLDESSFLCTYNILLGETNNKLTNQSVKQFQIVLNIMKEMTLSWC